MASLLKLLWIMILFFLPIEGVPQVPCYFIFGDSYSDNGNNNHLITLAKANYPPYGIDFVEGSTGRFSNGLNQVDVIAKLVGFNEFILPFGSKPSNGNIIRGVNYASSASGIRRASGKITGNNISLDKQISNHKTIISRLTQMMGNNTSSYLNQCLYSIAIGTNDYIFNYFFPFAGTLRFTPEHYANILIQQLSKQIKILHDVGARKIAIFGLLPLGCLPFMRTLMLVRNGCAENVNSAVKLYNQRVRLMVDEFNRNLTDSKFIYINAFEIGLDILTSPGFRVKDSGCCHSAITQVCVPFGGSCDNRSEYVFFDNIHLTESSYTIVGNRAYRAQSPNDAYPFDISNLLQLH